MPAEIVVVVEPEPEPTFEQALGQLERIVASLERGEPELTSALAKYEKGVLLLTQCHRLLDQAEQSVALLTGVDEEGNPLTAPFDAAATLTRDRRVGRARSPDAAVNPPTKRRVSGRPSTMKAPLADPFGSTRLIELPIRRSDYDDRLTGPRQIDPMSRLDNKMGASGKIYGRVGSAGLCNTKFS